MGLKNGEVPAAGTGPGEFFFPLDVKLDDSRNLFVADTMNHQIR